MKNKIVLLCLPIILLIGCAVKDVTLNENIIIDNSNEITIELANQIAENISITMTDSQKDIYKINNFSFIWLKRMFSEPKKQIKRVKNYISIFPFLFIREIRKNNKKA